MCVSITVNYNSKIRNKYFKSYNKSYHFQLITDEQKRRRQAAVVVVVVEYIKKQDLKERLSLLYIRYYIIDMDNVLFSLFLYYNIIK